MQISLTAIARLTVNAKINVERPKVPIVLLEYINLFNPSDNTIKSFGRADLFFTILYNAVFYFKHGYCS